MSRPIPALFFCLLMLSPQWGLAIGDVPLVQALDAVDLAWSTSEPNGWSGVASATAADGVDYASSGDGFAKASWLETTLPGPGLLRYRWRVSSDPTYDSLWLVVDDATLESHKGDAGWQWAEIALGPGEHRVRWNFAKRTSESVGENRALLDQVEFIPGVSAPLAESIEQTSAVTSGAGRWTSQATNTHDGVDAARSPALSDGQSSHFRIAVVGPGQLTFWWKVSSQFADKLTLATTLGSGTVAAISGEQNWQQATYEVGVGFQLLTWSYGKDASVSAGQDAAWVDQITFTPTPNAALADALDLAMLEWNVSGNWTPTTVASETHDGVDAAKPTEPTWPNSISMILSTRGPGVLRYWAKAETGFWQRVDTYVNGNSTSHYPPSWVPWTAEWQRHELILPPGPGQVSWQYSSADFGAPGIVLLDQMEFLPLVSLPEAADTSLTLTTGGDSAWVGLPTRLAKDAVDYASSGVLMEGQDCWLEATATGPGELSFYWSLANLGGVSAELHVDGVLNQTLPVWGPLRYTVSLGPGSHAIRWVVRASAGGRTFLGAAMVDQLTLTPPDGLTWAQALDLPAGFTGLVTGDGEVAQGQELMTHDGQDALQLRPTTAENQAWLSIPVQGPAIVDFWSRIATDQSASFSLRLDSHMGLGGRSLHRNDSDTGLSSHVWRRYENPISAGQYSLQWFLWGGSPSTTAWLDEVRILGPVPLTEGLGTELAFTTGGDAPWLGMPLRSSPVGEASARSGVLTAPGQESWIETNVTGPGVLRFSFQSLSYSEQNPYAWYVDGGEVEVLPNSFWQTVVRAIPAGNHTIRWVYRKDSPQVNDPHGWLDGVVFTPSAPTLDDALDLAGTSVIGKGQLPYKDEPAENFWEVDTTVSHDGQDSAKLVAGSGQLEIPVQGPGMATYWAKDEQFQSFGTDPLAAPWYLVEKPVPAGNHTFTIAKEYRTRWVDQFQVGQYVPVGEALDTSLPISSEGQLTGIGFQSPGASDGVDYLNVSPYDWQTIALKTSVTGPGTLRFHFKGNRELTVNGDSMGDLTVWRWGQYALSVGPGTHEVRWVNNMARSRLDSFDQFHFTSNDQDILPAIDWNGELPALRGGWSSYASQTAITHDGGDALEVQTAREEFGSLALSVTGPGVMSFRYRVNAPGAQSDVLGFSLDSVSWPRRSQAHDTWTLHQVIVPPGRHLAQWHFSNQTSTLAKVYLDEVRVAPAISLAEAVDATLPITTGGDVAWAGMPYLNAPDGSDAAESGGLLQGQESWLQTTVTGPGSLSFWWLANNLYGRFFFELDGLHMTTANSQWNQVHLAIPPGQHTLRWLIQRESSDWGSSFGTGRLDQLAFTPEAEPFLSRALDLPNTLPVGTNGNIPWNFTTAETHDGVDALKLHSLSSEYSTLVVPLSGSGLLTFWCRATNNWGTTAYLSSGSSWRNTPLGFGWEQKRFVVPPAGGTFSISNSSPDMVWLDQVEIWPEGAQVPLPEAMETILPVTTSATRPWLGRSFHPPTGDAVDFAQSSATASAEEPSWMETTVTGPGELSFRWKGEAIQFLLDGQERATLADAMVWNGFRASIPSGTHTARWVVSQTFANTIDPEGALDELAFESSTLSQALELPLESPLISTGRNPWSSQTGTAHDGVDAARSGALNYYGQTDLTHTVTGPGVLRFAYKVSTPAGSYSGLQVLREGQVQRLGGQEIAQGEVPWKLADVLIPPGAHRITWRYLQGRTPDDPAFAYAAWVDSVAMTSFSTVAEVPDDPTLNFTSGGNAPWQGQHMLSAHDREDQASSGFIGHGQESWLETTVAGPGTLSFFWAVSADFGDKLSVLVNGVENASINGQRDWESCVQTLPPGDHVIRWRYKKNSPGTSGMNLGFLDEVLFVPGDPPPLNAAVNLSGGLIACGTTAWRSQIIVTHDGVDALESGPAAANQPSKLAASLSITRRGELSFWTKLPPLAADYFGFNLPTTSSPGLDGWVRHGVILGAGTLPLAFTHTRSSSSPDGAVGGMWLDQVAFQEFPEVSLAEAGDGEGLQWTTNEAAPWTGEATSTAHDGVDQLGSGKVVPGQTSWIEVAVSGPGDLSFLWREFGKLLVDGQEATVHHPSYYAWTEVHVLLSPGPHTVRWLAYDNLFLDQVQFTPASQGVCRALDFVPPTGRMIISGQVGAIIPQTAITQDGQSALQLNQNILLDMTTTGPATASVMVKPSALLPSGAWPTVRLDAGSNSSSAYLTGTEWHPLSVPVDAGTQRLSLVVTHQNYGQPPAPIWLDQFQIQPIPDFSEALDTTLTFATNPQAPWSTRASPDAHDGVDAISAFENGSHANLESWIETTVTGPGTLRFWSRKENTDFWPYFCWSVDGIIFDKFSGSPGWRETVQHLPTGTHVVRWSSNARGVAMDQVSFTPDFVLAMPFAPWVASHGLEGNQALMLADPNADGVNNLLAYAFGIPPNNAPNESSAELPRQMLHLTPFGDCLALDYVRRQGTTLRYRPKFSNDLVNWTYKTGPVSVRNLGNGWERVTANDQTAIPGNGRRFGAVEVEP